MNSTFSDLAIRIRKAGVIVITGHQNPDGDCIGAMLGLGLSLKAAGLNAYVVHKEPLPRRFSYLPGHQLMQQSIDLPKKHPLLYITVDLANIERLGWSKSVYERADDRIAFDHHASNTQFCAQTYLDAKASSTCEILTEFLLDEGFPITPSVATSLYLGLITDSNRFLYDTTTERTLRLGAALLRHGARAQSVLFEEYQNLSKQQLDFEGELTANAKLLHDGKLVYATIRQSQLDRFHLSMQEAEGAVDRLRNIAGVEVAVILKEKEPQLQKISFRSKQYYDVSQLAKNFYGGGHKKAAGGSIYASFEQADQRLEKFLSSLSFEDEV